MAQYLNLEGLGTFLTNIKNNIKGWLGINASSGSSTKFLNEQGNFVTPSGAYPDMTAGSATNLAPGGTSGQYLKSNGANNAPSWDNTSNIVSGETRKLFGVKRALVNGTYTALLKVTVLDATNYAYSGAIFSFTARTANKQNVKGIITVSSFEYDEPSTIVSRTLLLDSKLVNDGSSIPKFYVRQTTAGNKWAYELWVRVTTNDCVISVNVVNDSRNFLETMSDTSSTAPERLTESDLYSNVRAKCTSNTVNTSKVGSSTNPVYVGTDGSVKVCSIGVHSFHFSSGGRYKLATISFENNNSAVYMGCQIALSYRIGGGAGTGSGILGMSFSEWNNGHWVYGPVGTFTLLSTRGEATSRPLNLCMRKVTNFEYILYVDTSSDAEISFSLSSGEIMSFEVPSTVTTIPSETSDVNVFWYKPSGSWLT